VRSSGLPTCSQSQPTRTLVTRRILNALSIGLIDGRIVIMRAYEPNCGLACRPASSDVVRVGAASPLLRSAVRTGRVPARSQNRRQGFWLPGLLHLPPPRRRGQALSRDFPGRPRRTQRQLPRPDARKPASAPLWRAFPDLPGGRFRAPRAHQAAKRGDFRPFAAILLPHRQTGKAEGLALTG
jgi:hypothetical protein